MTRPKLIAIGAAVILGAFLSGYAAHRPAPSVVKDERKSTIDSNFTEKYALALAELERTKRDLATWQAKASSADAHTTTSTEWIPAVPAKGGCPEIPAHVKQVVVVDSHAEEHTQSGTKDSTDVSKKTNAASKKDTAIESHETVVELHTVETKRPDWSLALMPGYQVAGSKAVDLRGPLVIGASVERRIVGPFYLGAWGSTSGAVGLSIRGEM